MNSKKSIRVNQRKKSARIKTLVIIFLPLLTLFSVQSYASEDPGCSSKDTEILDKLLSQVEQKSLEESSFLESPEGQFLNAVQKGNIGEAKKMLDEGVGINVQDTRPRYRNNNALHHAARTNNVEMARFLLKRGMDVNAAAKTGFTALHVASGLGNLTMVKFLIENGANLGQFDDYTGTPLHVAVIQGRAKVVDLLIKAGANVNAHGKKGPTPLEVIGDIQNYCPAHSAIIESLVKGGANLLEVGLFSEGYRQPSYVYPITRKEEAAFTLLRVAKSFDWYTPVPRGKDKVVEIPPIYDAVCSWGKGAVAKYLLIDSPDHEKNIKAVVGPWGSPLHCGAAINYEPEYYKLLLGLKFDPNVRNNDGATPLHLVSQYGTIEKAKMLLDSGADVNAVDANGQSPIFTTNNTDMVIFLADHGADIKLRDKNGASVVHQATKHHAALMEQIIQLEPSSVSWVDKNGQTPLHYSTDDSYVEVLVKNGANINQQDNDGNTALHLAIKNNWWRAARGLVKLGASKDIKNKMGMTPVALLPPESDKSYKTLAYILLGKNKW